MYFPSGSSGPIRQEFKMFFLNKFMNYIKNETQTTLISGDFNICHKSIDIHDPIRNKNSSGFLEVERKWVTNFLKSGFVDSFREKNKLPNNYSWWSYRARSRERNKGWRIDYHMISHAFLNKIKEAKILSNVKHSDHCPIYLELSL